MDSMPAGLLPWQERLIDLVAPPADWHQLDHFTSAMLALDSESQPVALTLQQHNHMDARSWGRWRITQRSGLAIESSMAPSRSGL